MEEYMLTILRNQGFIIQLLSFVLPYNTSRKEIIEQGKKMVDDASERLERLMRARNDPDPRSENKAD